MTFLAPTALGLLGLIPLVILIYMLRRRRPRLRVSSTLLWQQLTYEAEGKFSWQPPLRDLLLATQLLLVLVLVLALGHPAQLGPPSRHIVIVIDSSTSMHATDVAPSRLERAKREAADLIDWLNPSDRVTLIRAGSSPQLLVSSDDRAILHRAIRELPSGASRSNLRDSLALAAGLASKQGVEEIYLISDGQVGELGDLPAIPARVVFVPIGVDDSNQAITALSVRRSLRSPFNYAAFVRVTNYAQDPARMPMVALVDDQVLEQRQLNVPPQSHSELVFDLPVGARVLQMRLLNAQGGPGRTDVLPLDDQAQISLPLDRSLEVVLVSPDPRVMKSVLDQIPGLQVTTMSPSSYAPRKADIVVLDGFVPADLPSGNLLIVNPQADGGVFRLQGEMVRPTITSYDLGSPLLSAVDLASLNLPLATRMSLPTWANQVVGANEGPLVFHGIQNGRRVVVFTFSPGLSNLPFQVAFPILMANTVAWLSPSSLPGSLAAEEPVLIRPFPGASSLAVERPDGQTVTLGADGAAVAFADTGLVGSYLVVHLGSQGELGTEHFAVNVMDENESRIAPRTHLDAIVEAPSATPTSETAGTREIWHLLASLALLLLLMEWWLYNRQAAAAGSAASRSRLRFRQPGRR